MPDPFPNKAPQRANATLTLSGDGPASDSQAVDADGHFKAGQAQAVTRVKAPRTNEDGIAEVAKEQGGRQRQSVEGVQWSLVDDRIESTNLRARSCGLWARVDGDELSVRPEK